MNLCPITRVRHSCRQVAQQSTQVHIRQDRIPDYARCLPFEQLATPEHHPQRHYLNQGDATATFFITLDAVNFGSGYFPHLAKRPGMSGYYTIATGLTEYYINNGPLTASELATITPADCQILFQQDPANPVTMELMQHFARAWQELGQWLNRDFGGHFTALLDRAQQSARHLIELLLHLPSFQDQASYRGATIYFYKRAQLLAADLHLAFKGQGWGQFRDLDTLTIFADNLVPHVLRLDGILEYTPALAEHIDSGQLLPAGGEAEIEIRASALHAVEWIREILQADGMSITAMQLDYLLWNRGQRPDYKQARPRHRSRSIFY